MQYVVGIDFRNGGDVGIGGWTDLDQFLAIPSESERFGVSRRRPLRHLGRAPEQTPVYQHQAEADQGHAGKVFDLKLFPENDAAEKYGACRDQESDKQQVGCAGRAQDTEVDDIRRGRC